MARVQFEHVYKRFGEVTLHVDTEHIHLFDTDTGEAIF